MKNYARKCGVTKMRVAAEKYLEKQVEIPYSARVKRRKREVLEPLLGLWGKYPEVRRFGRGDERLSFVRDFDFRTQPPILRGEIHFSPLRDYHLVTGHVDPMSALYWRERYDPPEGKANAMGDYTKKEILEWLDFALGTIAQARKKARRKQFTDKKELAEHLGIDLRQLKKLRTFGKEGINSWYFANITQGASDAFHHSHAYNVYFFFDKDCKARPFKPENTDEDNYQEWLEQYP